MDEADRGQISDGPFDRVAFGKVPAPGQLANQLGQGRPDRVFGDEKGQHGAFDEGVFVGGSGLRLAVSVSHRVTRDQVQGGVRSSPARMPPG